jgi:DNA-binding transcriptional regulator YhcF (GntR family)
VLSFSQVNSRLARIILKQGVAVRNEMLPAFTQQDLAAMVGASRVVINRPLRSFEENGAIRLSRRRLVITDKNKLTDMTKRKEKAFSASTQKRRICIHATQVGKKSPDDSLAVFGFPRSGIISKIKRNGS